MTAREWGQLLLSLPYAFLLTLAIHRLVGIKRQWYWRAILFVSCILVCGIPIYVGDAVNILGVLPVFFFCIWFCCRGSRTARASMALILYPVAMSMSAVVDTAMMLRTSAVRLAVKTLLWLCIWLVIRRLLPKKIPELQPQLWALIDVLATLPLLTVICIVASGDVSQELELPEWILLPISTVVSIALLFAVVVLAKQEQAERERQLFQMRSLYYQNLEREQWQVRRLRHDLANHLQTMAALDGDAAREYLQGLIESPGMNASVRYCDNEVANTVLSSKSAHMEAMGIQFDCRVDIPSGLPMKGTDLCAVLANSLDNAIEACAKLPADRRRIALDAAVCKGLFALEVRNPFLVAPQVAGGKFITHKRDKQWHGFGLASIREIAERYEGTLDCGHHDGEFRLMLTVLADASRTAPASAGAQPNK